MRIIFLGSDRWFSGPVLAAILKAGFEVPMAVTKGEEGKRLIGSLVHKFRREKKTLVIEGKTEEDISIKKMVRMARMATMAVSFPRSDLGRSDLLTLEAIVLASFGPPFLPAEVLDWPKYGCLNVHASLLPRWRGASPVFASLREGDKETGVSIMRMTAEIDRGPILGRKKLLIAQPDRSKGSDLGSGERSDPFDTRETLTKKLGKLGGELIVDTLRKLSNDQIIEVKQPAKSPTPYTRRLTKDSGRIDWSKSPIEIERFIRAVTPWPGAWANAKFKVQSSKFKIVKLKILKAHLEGVRDFRGVSPDHENHEIKRKTRKRDEVKLAIDQVQLPGKTPITWKQFAAGHPKAKLE